MTLLVTAQSDKSVLFWGDGRGTFTTGSDPFAQMSPAPSESLCKVMPTAMDGVMWGFAGSNKIGLDVAQRMSKSVYPTWDKVKAETEEIIVSIVQSRRQQFKDAGGDPNNSGLDSWFLFAGTIGEETRILRIDNAAIGEWVTGLGAEGHGATQFRIMWNVYRELQPTDDLCDPEHFCRFADAFGRHCEGLYVPGHLWVHADGVWKQWRPQ